MNFASRAPIGSPSASADPLLLLGGRLRARRLALGLKLHGLSRAAELSVGLLSQLERGAGNPSYLTLAKLATALEVPVSYFFESDGGSDPFLVRRERRKRLTPASREAVFELLTPDLRGQLEVLWITLQPGGSEPSPYQHEGEECAIVLEGRVHFHLGEREYDLEPGDSLTFPGDMPHWAENQEDFPAALIVAITPPSF